jgi:YggT family protein
LILFANFLIAFAGIIHVALMIYIWVVIFRAILSWIRISSSFYRVAIVLYKLTEPVLRPFRRIVPPSRLGGIDISPVIVILLIYFVDSFLVKSISIYGHQLLRQHSIYF